MGAVKGDQTHYILTTNKNVYDNEQLKEGSHTRDCITLTLQAAPPFRRTELAISGRSPSLPPGLAWHLDLLFLSRASSSVARCILGD